MPNRTRRLTDWLTAQVTVELARDLGFLALFAAWAVGLVVLRPHVGLVPLLCLWAAWGVAFLLTMAIGWLRLFGPLLLYDLRVIGRKRRFVLFRCTYAVALLLLLAALYSYWTWDPKRVGNVTAPEMTRFAEMFFFSFMCAEFLAVLLLTPAYTAGAIAGEKDRLSLEFLLATDLHKREIVLSKLAARVANLGMLVLAGLPILSFTQFFGGIDPDLLLSAFAVLGLTMFSLAAVSILHSIYAQRSRTAIVLTYLTTALYLGLGFLAAEYVPEAPAVAQWGLRFDWRGQEYGLVVQNIVDAINAGNVIVALRQLMDAWKQSAALTVVLPGIVQRYAAFHAVAALLCVLWATARLRARAGAPDLIQQHRGEETRPWWNWPRFKKNPLLWKELVIDPGFNLHRIARILLVALALASFVPAVAACYNYIIEPMANDGSPGSLILRYSFRKEIQEWVRTVGTLVACLTLLAVAVRAAGSVSGERDRQTLDSLLTTPLNRDAILYSKWLASILAVRWTWLWLGLIWTVALAVGGLSLYALPLLVWAWIVYAMFASNLGLYFSTVCSSTLRATVATLLTLLCACFAHWLLLGCYLPFFLYSSGNQEDFPTWVITFQKYGLTPPLTWTALAFQLDDLRVSITNNTFRQGEGLGILIAALAGICVYGLTASVLWKLATKRFRILGVAQPLHQGLFPGKDPFIEGEGAATTADSAAGQEAIREPDVAVPLATPVDESVTPTLHGAVLIEEKHDQPADGANG
jgi:ABC-type transport system involved in multi-copper enzyme maturation permease subunit